VKLKITENTTLYSADNHTVACDLHQVWCCFGLYYLQV